MFEVFDTNALPKWVILPTKYFKLVYNNEDEFLPWYLLNREQFNIRFNGIKKRYPSRNLVPFARRDDNDDVACWDSSSPNNVFIIHDFASPGFEQREIFSSFDEWYKFAKNQEY